MSAPTGVHLAADPRGLHSLRQLAASGDPSAFKAVAREFETLLLQTLLKQTQAARLSLADDGHGNDGLGLYQELLQQQWAQQLARAGGVGFARMLERHLVRTDPSAQTG
ncbi:MAG: rod-binding protein [Thiobacillaceae bacterium]|nr:rod-binding protein [Thiobacillaceae bacterium]MCX7673798.1 rod-binding protein [Thiobacillaceae bacterium]MDW8323556.1 rod-binding protein [Burkholderiales bacterium]